MLEIKLVNIWFQQYGGKSIMSTFANYWLDQKVKGEKIGESTQIAESKQKRFLFIYDEIPQHHVNIDSILSWDSS